MASTYIQRTPSGAYYLKATFSFWFKRSGLGEMGLFGRKGSNQTSNLSTCHFGSNNDLLLNFRDSGGSSQYYMITNRKFTDTNAWYHFHYVIEGNNSTQGDRSRLYINGVRETSFSLNNNPSSNSYQIATFLSSNGLFTIGRALRSQTNTFGNFNGSISHFHCSTGYAYEPTVFGSTDATTGEWKINTSPTFTPGTDGFTVLKDGNTVTDQSAGSNNFSVGNGTLTKTEDNPSNNFATMNSLIPGQTNYTYSNGNNTITQGSGAWVKSNSTLGMTSGKYYWEAKYVSGAYAVVGVDKTDTATPYPPTSSTGIGYKSNGNVDVGTNPQTDIASYAHGDIVSIALDMDNNCVYFGKGGVWQNSGNPTSGSSKTGAYSLPSYAANTTYFTTLSVYSSGATSMNFGNGYFGTTAVASAGTNASGNGIFEYAVPTGYTALSTKGLNT